MAVTFTRLRWKASPADRVWVYKESSLISNKRISIKCVPHFDISIESRPRPLKASHVSYLNLQAINLNLNTSCAAKFFICNWSSIWLVKIFIYRWKICSLIIFERSDLLKKNMKKFLSFILTTWRMSTRKHALTQGIITCREKWYLW